MLSMVEASLNGAQAVDWDRKAAEQRDAKSQSVLGEMYKKGEGVLQDYVQAHKWFNLAAAKSGHADPVRARNQLAKQMTPAQIAEAQKLGERPVPS